MITDDLWFSTRLSSMLWNSFLREIIFAPTMGAHQNSKGTKFESAIKITKSVGVILPNKLAEGVKGKVRQGCHVYIEIKKTFQQF